jgi:hypothetical protein
MASGKCNVRLSAALATAAAGAAEPADAARSRRVRIAALCASRRLGRALITHAGEEQNLRCVAAFRAVLARTRRRSKKDQLAHDSNPDGALKGAPHACAR